MSQAVNSFSELNSDSHPLNTKPNVATDIVNGTLTTRGENQLILQNLKGTDLVSQLTPGYKPLAIEIYKNVAYILSAAYDSDGNFSSGEIGTFPSPDWDQLYATQNPVRNDLYLPMIDEYKPLQNFLDNKKIPLNLTQQQIDAFLNNDANYIYPFNTPLFKFKNDNLIEMELQPSYDGSLNIIITDNKNPIRLINSRFIVSENSKQAAIAERRQLKDTNTYSEARFLATKLLRNSSIIPTLSFDGVRDGGNLPGGGYKFYFKYIDSDGSLSEIIEESRLISVAYNDHGAKQDENTSKYIQFTLTNLDFKFSGLKVYFSYASGEVAPSTIIKEINNPYFLPNDGALTFRIYGTELVTDISSDKLSLDYSILDTAKSMTQKDDRLVIANISNSNEELELFRGLSQLITLEEADLTMKIKGLGEGYGNPDNVYFKTGLWAGETYELGICYILKDGRGTTPVFPIRGLDNFTGTQTYSLDPTNINFNSSQINTSDGFLSPASSENRIGAYRVKKNRTILTGVDKDQALIRYLKANINVFYNIDPANPYRSLIDNDIEGFFFVRKERKQDCIVQGYFTNTARVNINPITNESSPYYFQNFNSVQALEDAHALYGVRELIGKKDLPENVLKETKIIPAPGRIFESTIEDRLFQANSVGLNYTAKNPRSLSMQGRVAPDPELIAINGKQLEMHYAFYANDILANPALFASIFNNSNKSVSLNTASPVVMKQIFNANSVATILPGVASIYPIAYIGGGSTAIDNQPVFPGSSDTYVAFRSSTAINLSETAPIPGQTKGVITGQLEFKYYDSTLNPPWGFYGTATNFQPKNFILDVTIDELDNLTATMDPVSYSSTANSITSVYELSIDPAIAAGITGSWTNMSAGTILSSTFSLDIPIKITKSVTPNVGGSTTVTTDTKMLSFTGDYINLVATNNTIESNIVVSNPDTNNTPIKVLSADNFDFNPGDLAGLPPGNNPAQILSGQYISENLEAYTEDNFSAISSRNQYFYTTRRASGSLIQAIESNTPYENLPNNRRFLSSDAVRYSDYVGMRFKKPWSYLFYPLRNDNNINNLANGTVSNFVNFPSNNYGITNTDNGDWTYRVQHQGIRFAVIGNIYDSLTGPLDALNWRNKYTNVNFAETYFAITKRFNLKDIKDAAIDKIDLFGGDCYINYSYKRAFYGAGVDGVPTASDPSLYKEGEKSAGLYPKGFVFPLIMESNYNTSLRTFEFKDLIETGLYGKERTFYPIDNIDALRSSRQIESKGLNQGYNYDNSEKKLIALNDQAPVLNLIYDTRVMVSEPSVSGSFSNGYNNFSGLNYRDYSKHLGSITKIISHNNYLYCIQERGIGVIPMNQKTMISEQQGGVFLDNAQLLDSKLQIISSEYGSDQQFSIIKTDEAIYGCDLNKNKIWKIINQGGIPSLQLISDFAVQNILNGLRDKVQANGYKNFIRATYDRSANNVIFSYYNIDKSDFISDFVEIIIPHSPGAEPIIIRKPAISGLYFNETLGKWISRISWNPLFMFEIGSNVYSFSADNDGKLWKHYSNNVPYCYIYDNQEKFEVEFILLDNASAQKMLDNLQIISNRSFPGRIKYSIDSDVDYDNLLSTDNSYLELMRQRHEDFLNIIKVATFINGQLYFEFNLSQEELERLQGGYFTYNNNIYILGNYYTANNLNYIEILDQNANIINVNIPNITFSTLDFGIIKQNMEYIEDHLYVEVGKAVDASLIRDKAIRIRLTYEGNNYTVIQSIISLFQYSFS